MALIWQTMLQLEPPVHAAGNFLWFCEDSVRSLVDSVVKAKVGVEFSPLTMLAEALGDIAKAGNELLVRA